MGNRGSPLLNDIYLIALLIKTVMHHSTPTPGSAVRPRPPLFEEQPYLPNYDTKHWLCSLLRLAPEPAETVCLFTGVS